MYDKLHKQDTSTHNVSGNLKDAAAHKKAEVDLSVLLDEIKELRLQLQRSIDTNNALRHKLEEQIEHDANMPPPTSVINIHHVTSSTNSHQHTQSDNEISQPQNGTDNYLDQYTERMEKFTTDLIKEPAASLQKLFSNAGVPQNSAATLWDIEDKGNLQYPATSHISDSIPHMDARGRSVSGPAGVAIRGQGSQAHPHTDSMSSVRSRMHSEPHKHPDQMDRLREAGSDGVLSVRDLDMNGGNIRPHYAASHDKYGHQHYPNKLSPDKLSSDAHQPKATMKPATDENAIRYHINDIRPYPGTQSNVRVDSDLRQLFAIGKIDDYELLKKEVAESKVVLRGIESRLQEKLKIYKSLSTSESADYRLMRDLTCAVENERICLDEVSRVLALFWLSQLPAPDSMEGSESSEVKLLKQQISALHTDVSI